MTIKSSTETRSSTATRSEPTRPAPPPPPKPSAPAKPMKFADGFGSGALAEAREAAGKLKLGEEEDETGLTGKAESGFDRPKATADSISGGTTTKVSGTGNVNLGGGYGLTGGVSAVAKSAVSLGTKDGMTTFELKAELSGTVSGKVKAPVGSVEGSLTAGVEGRFSVSMPEEAAKNLDLSKIDPLDPTTMPTGTTVKLEGSSFTQTELGASFKALSANSSVKTAEGTSLAIEKTGDTTVRVTVGDTKAVDATTRVAVGIAGASVGIGRTDDIDSGTAKTVELDLATPEGAKAYADLISKGELPTASGPGVSGVTTKEYFTMTSSSALDVEVGGKTLAELSLGSNSGVYTRTTAPDGSITGAVDLAYEGGATLHVDQKFNPDGTERLDERTYEYTFKVSGETERGELGVALKQDLEVGQEISVKLTEAQMAELKSRGAEVANGVATATVSPESFAVALAAAPDGTLENLMFRVSDPKGTARSFEELKALPMEIIIRP